MEEIKGFVKKIVFENKDNGYTVLSLDFEGKDTTVVLSQSGVNLFNYLILKGTWIANKKFGKQFSATEYKISHPENRIQLLIYLKSGNFKGIGDALANRIVNEFGDQTFNVLNNEPDRLLSIKGISESLLESFKKEWNDNRNNHEIIVKLQELGLPKNTAFSVLNEYGYEILDIIKKDPYILYREGEVSFKIADEMALKDGVAVDHPERLVCGLLYTLKSALDNGDTYITKEEYLKSAQEVLRTSAIREEIITVIETLVKSGMIAETEFGFTDMGVFKVERTIAKILLKMTKEDCKSIADVDQKIKAELEFSEIKFSEEQYTAVKNIVNNKVSVLTGGAGVGKTTTVKFILKLLLNLNQKIVLAAPTGRAAQRMAEVSGYEVKTIHRLLKFDFESGEFVFNENNPLIGDFFVFDESSMIDIFLMKSLLKAIPPNAQILFIGDPNQLPSVGAGDVLHDIIDSEKIPVYRLTQIFRQDDSSKIVTNSYKVVNGQEIEFLNPLKNFDYIEKKFDLLFFDSTHIKDEDKPIFKKFKDIIQKSPYKIIESEKKSSYMDLSILKTIRNLKDEKELKKLAHINKYDSAFFDLEPQQLIEKLMLEIIPRKYGLKDIQILCPQKKSQIGTGELNYLIQEKINPRKNDDIEIKYGELIFREKDKVIQLKNNYTLNIFNGEIGYIEKIYDGNKMLIDFSYSGVEKKIVLERDNFGDLDLAYAITIHKSQGSEFDCVIIPISFMNHAMLYRNLIYTGMTRGKKLVVFVGQKNAMKYSIENNLKKERQTNLIHFLSGKIQ